MAMRGYILVLLLAVGGPVLAGTEPPVPQEQVLQERAESLAGVLDHDEAGDLAKDRHRCATGIQPATIERNRGFGSYSLPDAADYCAAVLLRQGREGDLLSYYRELLQSLIGDSTGYEHVPTTIATTITEAHGTIVPLGRGKGTRITPALAWDAGFTVAYGKRERAASGMPDAATLKPRTTRCLALSEPDLGLCYALGYAYGVLAVNGENVAAVGTPQD